MSQSDDEKRARERARKARWEAAHPEWRKAYKEANREKHLLRYRAKQYGITEETLTALLAAGCAVCGSTEDLHIDHDHNCCPEKSRSCGRCVRAALCNRHNVGVGMFADDPDALLAAAAYLLSFSNLLTPAIKE